MRSLRRHLVATFTACLTLAIGIALGSGPLQGANGNDDFTSLAAANAGLRDQLRTAEAAGAVDATLAEGLAPRLLPDRLTGRGVAIFVLPGVSESSVTAMGTAIQQAGGSVAVVVTLDDDVIDASKRTYVGSVASSSVRGLDLEDTGSDQAFAQLGVVLARAYVGTAKSQAFDDTAIKIDSELQGARLVTLGAEPTARGTSVVVLASGDNGDAAVTSARNVITADLLSTVVPAAEATVVVTPATGRDDGGLLDVLSDSEVMGKVPVSTSNAGTSSAGTLVGVYALSAALSGSPGDFGVIDGKPVLPRGLAPTDR